MRRTGKKRRALIQRETSESNNRFFIIERSVVRVLVFFPLNHACIRARPSCLLTLHPPSKTIKPNPPTIQSYPTNQPARPLLSSPPPPPHSPPPASALYVCTPFTEKVEERVKVIARTPTHILSSNRFDCSRLLILLFRPTLLLCLTLASPSFLTRRYTYTAWKEELALPRRVNAGGATSGAAGRPPRGGGPHPRSL